MQCYDLIPDHSYLAISTLIAQNQSGSVACRQLLDSLKQKLSLSGALCEAAFPYHFVDNYQTTWYVCFSHSHNHVAVLLSKSASIGVDVEDRLVSEAIASRYFAPREINWLQQLNDYEQVATRKLLWLFKESYIKTKLGSKQLFKGLGTDITNLVTIDCLTHFIQASEVLVTSEVNNLIVGRITHPSCAFIIGY